MNRALVLCCVAACAAGLCAARGASIEVTAEPPLPAANLVKNPGMEEGRDGQPAHWTFHTAMPGNFRTAWREDGRSGKCLWVKAFTGKMSGYWSQRVAVQPGRAYLFRGYYRLKGGRILCYAHARRSLGRGRSVSVDERFYAGSLRGHWLSPVFLPPDALMGPDPKKWYPFHVRVVMPKELPSIALSLGVYFTPGEVSYDDVWFGPAETTLRVRVQAGPGEPVRRVRVWRIGQQKPVFDSGPLKPGRAAFRCAVPGQPTVSRYRIEAALADGRTATATYPRQEGRASR